MASETYGRSHRVQGRVSEPIGSIPSRSPSSFEGPDELARARAPPLRLSNVLAVASGPLDVPTTAFVSSKAPPRVYSDEEIQDII